MPIPPELLASISGPSGVVIIVGAGCSVEPPTNLKGGAAYASEAHRQLCANGMLQDGDCENPNDLCCVTDAVVAKHDGSQKPMVDCLPIGDFRHAEPNIGYSTTAVLMREGAVQNVLTLNFDLALSKALSEAGVVDDVSVVSGPDQHANLGNSNVVYLHRNVECDPEDLILTTSALEDGWKDEWEQAIANMMLAAPTVVFAGLGSKAEVLTETIRRLSGQLGNQSVYLIGRGDPDQSDFFTDLGIDQDKYVKMPWCEFMENVGHRVLADQVSEIQNACNGLEDRNGYPKEELSGLSTQLSDLGLVGVGRIRARWLLHNRNYATHGETDTDLIADIVLAIAMIERLGPYESKVGAEGFVSFWSDTKLAGTIGFVSGRGSLSWLAAEAEIKNQGRYFGLRLAEAPRQYILSGIEGGRPADIGAPEDISGGRSPGSIVAGDKDVSLYLLSEIRHDNNLLSEILN